MLQQAQVGLDAAVLCPAQHFLLLLRWGDSGRPADAVSGGRPRPLLLLLMPLLLEERAATCAAAARHYQQRLHAPALALAAGCRPPLCRELARVHPLHVPP